MGKNLSDHVFQCLCHQEIIQIIKKYHEYILNGLLKF